MKDEGRECEMGAGRSGGGSWRLEMLNKGGRGVYLCFGL